MQEYLIPGTDLRVSRLAFGCDRLVREDARPDDLTADDVARAARLVSVAHANGITLFDTAAIYGGGTSETALGRALANSSGLREQIVIQTKFMGQSRASVEASVETSLRRLGTDYLDILLMHNQDPLLQAEELAEAFDELHRSGKVRYFGVSNHSPSRIDLLTRHLRQPLVVNQFQLGLAHPDLLDEVYFDMEAGTYRLAGSYLPIAGVDYSRLNGLQVQAYSPLRGSSVYGSADLLGRPTDAPPPLRKTAEVLHELAAAKESTPAAVGLAWLLHHPAGIQPIIGSKREENIVDCCTADDLTLTPAEWKALWATTLYTRPR